MSPSVCPRPAQPLPATIRARSAAPIDIARTFEEQARHTTPGLFGPVGLRPIYIPIASGAMPSLRRAWLDARRPSTSARRLDVYDVRAQTLAIGGYAAIFGVRSIGRDVTIAPGQIALVRTGLVIEVPIGHCLAIFARSSTPLKRGLLVANGVGGIDPDSGATRGGFGVTGA